MTQSAVSQVVRQLESDVGSAVLDRDLRPLRLTAAGAFVLERARRLLADADRLCTEVRLTEDSVLPRLRIGFVDALATAIGPAVASYMKDEIEQMQVTSGVAAQSRSGLINRDLDMIVSSDSLEDVAGIMRRRLLRESFVIIAPLVLKSRLTKLTLAELAGTLPLIRFSTRTQMGEQIDRHLGWLRIDLPRRLELDSSGPVLALVANGAGWAIVPPLTLVHAAPLAGSNRDSANSWTGLEPQPVSAEPYR